MILLAVILITAALSGIVGICTAAYHCKSKEEKDEEISDYHNAAIVNALRKC